jgi:hypothetical protein
MRSGAKFAQFPRVHKVTSFPASAAGVKGWQFPLPQRSCGLQAGGGAEPVLGGENVEKKEKTILNVSVSITGTDVFEHVLAILRVIYRNTKDEDLKKYIEEELDRALKGEWDIEGVLSGSG